MDEPRLRGDSPRRRGPYPLGQIPDSVLMELGCLIVHRKAIGHGDIEGNDFATMFAQAIRGEHLARPVGVADVLENGCAWSLKTVSAPSPFTKKRVRLISGRNSPDYSHGISDPRASAEATGRAVLSIWNARVNEAMGYHTDLRIVVLVRNFSVGEYVIFEESAARFVPDNYAWEFNKKDNLEGFDNTSGQHCFTWQPHGSQFTVFRDVPGSARRFSVEPNVPLVDPETILAYVKFKADWIKIHA